MCDPVTMTAIGVAATVGSTAMSAVQARQKSKYQKGVAEYNTRVSENEAQNLRNKATEAENIRRSKTARLLAAQQAQMGAANIDLNSGSALQLQEDTINLGEADALRIRTTGDDQYTASMQQAELDTAQGEMAEAQGDLDVFGSLLSGTAKIAGTGVADKWFTEDSVAG